MNKVEKIRAEIARLHDEEWLWGRSTEAKYRREAYKELLDFIDSLPEEPEKRKVKVILEQASDGNYSLCMDADDISYLVTGAGKTKEEAIQYFKNGYEDMKRLYAEDDMPFEECEFEYVDTTMEAEK